jgi:histidinol-phosphatase
MDQSGAFGTEWSAGLRRAPEAELDQWLTLAHAACDEADAIARSAFRRDLEIATKPDRTFVTQADTAIERAIRARILTAYPDHGLVGEEYGTEAADAPTRWYIDPIDGTHNFIRGVPLFGTLLAVERDGELQAAILSAPALRERWWARRGGGAWARSAGDIEPRRIRVSRVVALADAQLLYGSGHDIEA